MEWIKSGTMGPPKMLIYGGPGVGKSTFAANAGAAIIDCENGLGAIKDAIRTPYLSAWKEIKNWLVKSVEDTPDFIAIDTIDWCVSRIIEHVCIDLDGKKPDDITNTIGTAHGGYFKAREIVTNIVYREMLPMLNEMNKNGAVIILLGHAANTKITTPEGYDLRLAGPDIPQFVAPVFVEWADVVGYATRKPDGNRVLMVEGTNTITAKNRYGMPAEIEFDFNSIVNYMKG